MGNSCHSKPQGGLGTAAPPSGRFVASGASEPLPQLNGHAVKESFVKMGRKEGVLYLNDPLPDTQALKRKEDRKKQQAEAKRRKQEEAIKRKLEEAEEERRQKEEETKRTQEAEVQRRQVDEQRRQEDEAKRRAEQRQAEEDAKKRQEEAKRLQEETIRQQEETKKLQEEAKRRQEEARRRQEEAKRRRQSDAARAETYSLRQLRHTYANDFPTFLLNNTLMAVQFATNERELFQRVRSASSSDIRESEITSRLSATGHLKRALCPDALHEHLAQAVRYMPENDPYVATGVPLRPLRVIVNHEDVTVTNQTEAEPGLNIQLGIEQATSAVGYVRLLNLDPRLQQQNLLQATYDPEEGYPGFSDLDEQHAVPAAVRVPEASSSDSEPDTERRPSSISWGGVSTAQGPYGRHPRFQPPRGSNGSSGGTLSLPKSSNSNSDSEHSYSTIASLRRQLPLAEWRRQQTGAAASKAGLPPSCFVRRTVPSYNDESQQLFKTKHYLSSTAFMDNFSVVFADLLARDLGFLPLWTDEATVCGSAITVKTTSAKLEITPTLRCAAPSWPEKAVEYILRNRVEAFDQRTLEMHKWPSNAMMHEVTGRGYHMVPMGFIPRKGNNLAFEREWRIEFPEAERYLETCLSDTQLRCYIFCLLLFQVFFKIEHGVTEDHLRHVIFWQAENLTLAWGNNEMYNNIRAVYESLFMHLARQELPNYFIRRRNDLMSISPPRLQTVQRKLKIFRENPFGHIVAALRHLHLPGGSLGLNLARLLDLIKRTYVVELMNPDLRFLTVEPVGEPRGKKTSAEEVEGFWTDIRKTEQDEKKAWRFNVHKKLEEQRKQELKQRRESNTPRVTNRPLVEVVVDKSTRFDVHRRRLILEFFAEHFVQLAAGPGRPRPSSETLNHAQNLLLLLVDHDDTDASRLDAWRTQLERVRGARPPLARPAMELPPEEEAANWTLRSNDFHGRRLMRDAPPTMVFRRVDEESEPPESEDTDL